jgi:hypothetical protein
LQRSHGSWLHTNSAGDLHFLYANPKHPAINVKAFVALAIEMLPAILRGAVLM